MKLIWIIALSIASLISITLQAQPKSKSKTPAGLKTITLEDLKKDVYAMADPHFNGRSAGTIDELKASMWFAERMREAGIAPAGDDGTYFQFFSMQRHRISSASTISIGSHHLKLWSEVLITQIAPAQVNAPVVYLGEVNKIDLNNLNVQGKAVAVHVVPDGINLNVSLPEWRYNRLVMTKYGNDLISKGAAAVIFISDEYGERAWPYAKENLILGTFANERTVPAPEPKAPIMWLHSNATEWIRNEGLTLNASLIMESFTYPSVNIIGKVEGNDSVLKNEYVLLSGHHDALGIRNVIGNDSIYHGADDNVSVNVAMLATARALKKFPGKRSALLVIHGAEERGLIGSRYFASHPTVPISSIVTVLNGDMIGRNHPDSAALLGSQAPHRSSSDLVTMAMEANAEGPQFKLDTLWDKPTHIEGWFFRSDHLPYARLNIPSLMYTTLLHPDYHTPQDNAQNIDYEKLLKMTQWIYRTAWKVVNAYQRPAIEPNFKLER
jgi:Peptidase family M28